MRIQLKINIKIVIIAKDKAFKDLEMHKLSIKNQIVGLFFPLPKKQTEKYNSLINHKTKF